eukprot:Gb_16049 [translate_table: standard]
MYYIKRVQVCQGGPCPHLFPVPSLPCGERGTGRPAKEGTEGRATGEERSPTDGRSKATCRWQIICHGNGAVHRDLRAEKRRQAAMVGGRADFHNRRLQNRRAKFGALRHSWLVSFWTATLAMRFLGKWSSKDIGS